MRLRICFFSQQLQGVILLFTLMLPGCLSGFQLCAAGNHFSVCCSCSSVAGTAGQTAPVYSAGFHPHFPPGLKHDCPFPIFSLPVSDSFTVSFYIQKGIVQERSELLLQLCAAHTKAVSGYPSLTQCSADLEDQSIWLTADFFPTIFSSSVCLISWWHWRRGGRTEELDWHLSRGDKNSRSPL